VVTGAWRDGRGALAGAAQVAVQAQGADADRRPVHRAAGDQVGGSGQGQGQGQVQQGPTGRISPVTAGGRSYVARALPSGTMLTRLALAGTSGHTFATGTSIPPVG
jgi:hypothetical protein